MSVKVLSPVAVCEIAPLAKNLKDQNGHEICYDSIVGRED